jgi:hypothetical protein
MTWQPIGTAPKDGTPVLVYDASWCGGPPRQTVTTWTRDLNKYRVVVGGSWSGVSQPTHWMPLPDPPAEETR